MKLQMDQQNLRLRIDEAELAHLLDGNAVNTRTQFASAFAITCSVQLHDADDAALNGSADAWHIALPSTAVRELAARLPTRDGLVFSLPGNSAQYALELRFDVDVRDSVRHRRAT